MEKIPLKRFFAKTKHFLGTCIKHLQYSRKALFSHILASFSKLIDFTINSLQKKWLSSFPVLLK